MPLFSYDRLSKGLPEKGWVWPLYSYLSKPVWYFITSSAPCARRELGITFVIAMARHRLQREPCVGMSPAAVRAMRDARGQAVRRHQGAALPDQWVYDFYWHQAPAGGTWGDVGGQGVSVFECLLACRCPIFIVLLLDCWVFLCGRGVGSSQVPRGLGRSTARIGIDIYWHCPLTRK